MKYFFKKKKKRSQRLNKINYLMYNFLTKNSKILRNELRAISVDTKGERNCPTIFQIKKETRERNIFIPFKLIRAFPV